MTRHTTIHIRNQYLKFSAAHFTIFSASERERLHGHNFAVTADIMAPVSDEGLCFDYNVFKKVLRELCDGLDEYTLIAGKSPHLSITTSDDEHQVTFAQQTLRLLKSDTIIMPLANITAEELSCWLLQQLLARQLVEQYGLVEITVFVASGYGQAASTRWSVEGGIA